MPTFITVKKWIIEAAAEHGVHMPTRRAKSLAAAWLSMPDPLEYLRITYSDPVGESVARSRAPCRPRLQGRRMDGTDVEPVARRGHPCALRP